MYDRISKIDELSLPDHHYLDSEDDCYYFGEYTARKGYSHSATNQLISNLKKKISLKRTPQYQYKHQAIRQVSNLLGRFLSPETITFIPVPPSKDKSHPEYDDRLIQVFQHYHVANNLVDFRELVHQTMSTEAAHESEDRPSPGELESIYHVDGSQFNGVREHICIFDDVITTGSHFKAMQSVLKKLFPGRNIFGLFVARRVPEAVDWDEFF